LISIFGGSALTADIAVPKNRDATSPNEIPITYVQRETRSSSGARLVRSTGCGGHFRRSNAIDYSYRLPTGIYQRVRAAAASRKWRRGRSVQFMLRSSRSRADIIRKGTKLGVDFHDLAARSRRRSWPAAMRFLPASARGVREATFPTRSPTPESEASPKLRRLGPNSGSSVFSCCSWSRARG
jgi:hypothetical protein